MDLLSPILTLTGLGVIFGAGLAFAAKRLCVTGDPRLEKIYSNLPGANCGACGKAGCMGFAEGLIQGTCSIEGCAVAEENVRKMISEILGVEHKQRIKNIAVLHCNGGDKRAKNKFEYSGLKDCISANLIAGGPKACIYGCIGFVTCVRLCPFGAITMNEENLPVVDEDKCTACGKCVAGCPKKLFSLEPINKNYAVRCKSLDLAKKVMQVCSVGCIACRKCEKACPVKAIKVIDNLSVIDYNICDNRGACLEACPTKSIAKREDKIWQMKP